MDLTITDKEFELFRQLIHQQTGIALSDAKKQLVRCRLQKRLTFHGMTSFSDYYGLLDRAGAESEEMLELINCITTNKTDFYREPHHFDYIAQELIPHMKANAKCGLQPRKLRVWHAGCSSGEEPYTLAITLAEHLLNEPGWDVLQLASDIDTHVLSVAREGIYDEARLGPIPQNLRQKYFLRSKRDGHAIYKVRESLKNLIRFRQINLLRNPWPIRSDVRFDIIFCRNVVIYFDKPTQRKLFGRFAELLKPGGHLFIGHSENLHGISDRFETDGGTIYRLIDRGEEEAA